MNGRSQCILVLCVLGLLLWLGQSLIFSPADAAQSGHSQHMPARRVGAKRTVVQTPTPRHGERIARFDEPLATPTRTPTPINIGNRVWSDPDGDGIQDAGEPGLQGITVQLWNASKTALLDQTTTNANGNYTVVAPVPGDYRVRVLLPAGTAWTLKDQGADDQDDSDINPAGADAGFTDVLTIASNVISTTIWDAGIVLPTTPTPTRTPTPINIGNFVWNDLNGDGVQTSGEPGVAGVTVQLWNSAKTQVIASTTTNNNGIYTVVAPVPGDYLIRVLLPTGASFALKDQGSDTQDSDINRVGANFGFTDMISIASNVISTTIWDAGLINVQPSPTPSPTNTPTRTPTGTPVPSNPVHVPIVRN